MSYALVLDDDPVAFARVLDRTLARASGRLRAVFAVPGIANAKLRKRYSRAMLRIVGARYAVKTVGRYLGASSWTLDGIARRHGTPFFRCPSVNSAELRARLSELGVTGVLSVTAEIYRRDTLSMPGVAFYNFHGSILPANKGLFPFFWAFMNDARQGVTVHRINEKIDEGEILFQTGLDARGPSLPEVTDALLDAFPELVTRAMDALDEKRPPVLMNEGLASSYHSVPNEAEIRRYFEKLRAERAASRRSAGSRHRRA